MLTVLADCSAWLVPHQASLLSQPTSPMFTVRSLSISGLYLSYESMATLAYRILVRHGSDNAASQSLGREPLKFAYD